MPNTDSPSKVITISRKLVNLMDPEPETICFSDIVHALSHICRFSGHTPMFYSVAQHSVAVSSRITPEHAAWGLMHDAAEAYTGDVIRPLRNTLMTIIDQIEAKILRVIAAKFNLPWPPPTLAIDRADNEQLAQEFNWIAYEPDFSINYLTPWQAARTFKARAEELGIDTSK